MSTVVLVDVENAATYLGTTVSHMRGLVNERRIPYVKVGGKVRFRVTHLDQWIDANTTPARTATR